MKRFRVQIIIGVVALVIITLLLIGQEPVSELDFSGPEPSEGGLYVEALIGEPNRFNPLLDEFNPVDKDVNQLIFSGLLTFDAWGNPIPDLAEDWGVSVNGDVFNITLREGLVWHDGEPLTTDDVLFTIELMRDPQMPGSEDILNLWTLVEVVVFDERTMQFQLAEPYVPFTDYLSFGILPRHLLGGKSVQGIIDAPFNLSPIGSGPYEFEELLVEEGRVAGVVLHAFDSYYRERPFIDQLVLRYYPTSQEAYQAYKNDEVMGIAEVDLDTLPDVLSETGLSVYTTRRPQMSMVLLNLNKGEQPYFAESQIRKALMMAMNRPWMISEVMHGQAVVADGPIFPGTWAYYGQVEKYEFAPDEAIQILKDAGYVIPAEGGSVRAKDGLFMRFTMVHPNTPEHTKMAAMIKSYWEEIGVSVELVAVEYSQLISDYLDTGVYDAALIDLDYSGTADPDPYPIWHQAQIAGGQNYSGWNDRRASEYLEQARVTPNYQERLRLYRNFQIHFSRELPAIPLFYPVYNYAVAEDVQGIALGPLVETSTRFHGVHEWYLVSAGGQEIEIQGGETTPEE